MKNINLIAILSIFVVANSIPEDLFSQNVGIGINTPNTSAKVDITSTGKGFLIPRMSTAIVSLIGNPAKGLLVYDSSKNQLLMNTGIPTAPAWQALAFTGAWTLTGNSGTNPSLHFIGTTDNTPLRFRVNNEYAGEIDSVQSKTFFGYLAGSHNSSGHNNVGIGNKSLYQVTSGYGNTAVGDSALLSDTSGFHNTGLGAYALLSNTYGEWNTATGTAALYSSVIGGNNTAHGCWAIYTNQYGSLNTGIGESALFYNKGLSNTAVGWQSLNSNSSGLGNTAAGQRSLWLNQIGSDNTAIGYSALNNNQTGTENTAAGYNALYNNLTGSYNTGIGSQALSASQFNSSTAIGYAALRNNHGFNNDPTSGAANVATGAEALTTNSVGSNNTATGFQALFTNYSGNNNSAIGYRALFSNSYGVYNTAAGNLALYSNISTDWNTALGDNALFYSVGSNNTAVGGSALANTTIAQYNTVIGYNSALIYDMWNYNTFLGANCDVTGPSFQNCVAIGQSVSCTANNQARIGNAYTWSIGGYAGWSNISDGRFKKELTEDVKGLAFVLKLRPVTYHLDLSSIGRSPNSKESMKMDTAFQMDVAARENEIFSGFVAQEVEIAGKQAGYNFSGVVKPQNENDVYMLRYAEFVVPLIKSIQEQQLQLEQLKKANAGLKALSAQQESIYQIVLKQIESMESNTIHSKN